MKTAQQINLHVDGCRCGTCQWVESIQADARQSALAESENWEATLEAYGVEPERVLEKIKDMEKQLAESQNKLTQLPK